MIVSALGTILQWRTAVQVDLLLPFHGQPSPAGEPRGLGYRKHGFRRIGGTADFPARGRSFSRAGVGHIRIGIRVWGLPRSPSTGSGDRIRPARVLHPAVRVDQLHVVKVLVAGVGPVGPVVLPVGAAIGLPAGGPPVPNGIEALGHNPAAAADGQAQGVHAAQVVAVQASPIAASD
jgi:hypothetical protein